MNEIMENVAKNVNIAVAVPSKTPKGYSQTHTTTLGFMKPRPIFAREYVPNRDMRIDVKAFVRANPMPVPIFGRVNVHNRMFFVPYHTVMKDFNAFISNTIYNYPSQSAQIPNITPCIKNSVFVEYFLTHSGLLENVASPSSQDDYDIAVITHNGSVASTSYYTFTSLGCDMLAIIESLGYKINWIDDDGFEMPAMPLMAFAKVMIDWYYPSAYVGDSAWNFVAKMFNTPLPNHYLDYTELSGLLAVCRFSCYENDYFVNGWDNPIGPNQGIERSMQINDITTAVNSSQSVVNDSTNVPLSGTPVIDDGDGYVAALSQYMVNALRSMTDYTVRHRLSGIRALDRYLTEYGVNLRSELLDRSMYLGSQTAPIEFYDVFSTSDTYNNGAGARLGDFAGRGQSWDTKGFKMEKFDEFGYVIIVNTLVPEVSYTQGLHREMMHVHALDFYHPDYDHMIVQAIAKRELFVSRKGTVNISSALDGIFAYTSKYIEYNMPKDLETGLYRIHTRKGMLPLYTLKRDLSYYENGNANQMVHNYGFVVGNDSEQYLRIFYNDSKYVEDQFNAIFRFDVVNDDSTLKPYESYAFDHDGKGKDVSLDVNGSKLN